MTARLLCPACGARVREANRGQIALHGWLYWCTSATCEAPTNHPVVHVPETEAESGIRSDQMPDQQVFVHGVDFDPDAARRARIRPAMEVDDGSS